MTPGTESNELTLECFARLPGLGPDPVRADCTRRRCHAVLQRRQHREQLVARVGITRSRVAPVVVGAVCVFFIVYVGALVATTLHLQALLP